VNTPVRPAKIALPVSCDAAPVEAGAEALDEAEPDVEVPFSWSLPPEPAVDAGETLSVACFDAFLKASRVFAPEVLLSCKYVCINGERVKTYGGLITPTIPLWQCLP
jgi:hypothetical protein